MLLKILTVISLPAVFIFESSDKESPGELCPGEEARADAELQVFCLPLAVRVFICL